MSNEQFAGQNVGFKQKFTKRRVVVTMLFMLGAYAAIQSVVSFGKTEDTVVEPSDKVVKQVEVKKDMLHVVPPAPTKLKTDNEGDIDVESYGLFGYVPNDNVPLVPVPVVEVEEEELDLTDLTVDDCIEADIVMASINPEDINDAMVAQCLILWEDLQDLLDEVDEEVATTTPTTTPRRGGGGGGGGTDNPPEEDPLSTNSDLGIFDVDKINILPFDGLRVADFDEDGATLLVDDYFCKETELTAWPCFHPGKPLMGVFLAAADEKSSYARVEIERNNPLLLEYSPARVWENDEISKLAKEEILPGDIIRVTAIAEDGVSQSLFKLNVDALASDANLNIFDVDFVDVLPFDGLQVKKFDDPGAILNMYNYLCDPSVVGPEPCVGGIGERITLSGLMLQARDRNISHSKVEIERRSPFSFWDTPIKIWEGKEIDQLRDMQIWPDDIIRVTIVAENGRAENLFKLSVVNQTDNADLSQFNIGTSPVLEWPNIEVKDINSLGAIANICPENINGEASPYFTCITTLDGVFITPEDEDVRNITVSIYHENLISKAIFVPEKFDFFEGEEEIKQLEKYQLVQDDMIFVQVTAEDGATIKNYKIQVIEGDYTENVSLAAFTVGGINALALPNVEIAGWYDQGAVIELCNPTRATADCIESLEGIIVKTEEDTMYRGVYIERDGDANSLIWVNDQIDGLVNFEVLPNDIIRVVVVASNGKALGFYKVSVIYQTRNDILLSEFTIDTHNALLLPDVKIDNLSDAGATLFVPTEEVIPCSSNRAEGCTTIDLTGIYAAQALKDVDITVYTFHDYWSTWVGEEGIGQLVDHELAIGDMVAVLLKEENGLQQTLYKVTIAEKSVEPLVIKKFYPSKFIGGGGSVAPVKKKPLEETDFSNIQDQELKKEEVVNEIEVEKTPEPQPDTDDVKIIKEPIVVKETEETEE